MQNTSLKDHLKERLQFYFSAIETKVIEHSSYIVEVGALTVGTDEIGKVIAQNVYCPAQFSKSAVEIIQALNWRDGNNKPITPIVFFKNDWYKEKINLVEETLKLLN